MAIKILSDIVTVVSEHIANPSTSEYDIFVGLEHYDAGEPVITRYGSTAQLESSVKHFNEGDILVARRNVYLKRAGVVKFEGVTSGDSIVLRVKDERYKAIIPFLLNTEEFWDYAEQNSDGTMSKRLAPDVLLEYECDIPDNHKEIADKLWAAYELKEAYKKMIAATDEMVKSQFIEMFGSGHWEQKCLGEVGTFKRGGGFQKSDYVECGIPCIHYGQIHTKFGPFIYSHISEISSDLECKTKFASKGDLIIAITSEDTEGSCKSTAWLGDYPVAVGGHAAIFHHSMNPVYMSFFFKSVLFNHAKMEYIHGTKVCEIKPDDIAKILVPYPPMSLQEEFSSIAQQADKSKFELRQAIEKIDKVMKSLLQ